MMDKRQEAYRLVTIVQIAFSVLSLLTVAVLLPLMYNLVEQANEYATKEIAFCDASNLEALSELNYRRYFEQKSNRTVRQYGGGPQTGVAGVLPPMPEQCPGCCIPGPAGPRGTMGAAGKAGLPGLPGTPGAPGITPNATCPKNEKANPPPCKVCPRGPPGIKGWPGFPGDPGPVGEHGAKGKDGTPGANGDPGPQGPEGFKGPPGPPGEKGPTPDGHIRPGPPGDLGDPGPIGPPGTPGLPGRDGPIGKPGDKGWPGEPGEPGESGYPGVEGAAGLEGPPGSPGECVCKNVDNVIVVDPAPPPAPAYPAPAYPAPAPAYPAPAPAPGGYSGRALQKDAPSVSSSKLDSQIEKLDTISNKTDGLDVSSTVAQQSAEAATTEAATTESATTEAASTTNEANALNGKNIKHEDQVKS